MADENSTQFGRLVYFEPVNIGSKDGYSNYVDNKVFNPEDFNMFVDIQVIVPRRTDIYSLTMSDSERIHIQTSSEGQNDNGYVSFLQGSELKNKDGKTVDYDLTTDYINATYTELYKDGKTHKEALNIDSIDITFDSHFFPQVSIKFIDMRGYSVMMPEEEQYRQNVVAQKDPSKKGRQYTNFFRALFHFPYPKFYLTVKGFYGTPVTFTLAPNDFKSSFNSQTGNFEISVAFIGYMYGLYTDLPLNLLIGAPYMRDTSENGEESDKWNTKNYLYDDGNQIQTFAKYFHNYYDYIVGIRKAGEASRNYDEERVNQINAEQNELKSHIEELESIKDSFKNFLNQIYSDGKLTSEAIEELGAYYCQLSEKEAEKNYTLNEDFIKKCGYDDFYDKWNSYNQNHTDSKLSADFGDTYFKLCFCKIGGSSGTLLKSNEVRMKTSDYKSINGTRSEIGKINGRTYYWPVKITTKLIKERNLYIEKELQFGCFLFEYIGFNAYIDSKIAPLQSKLNRIQDDINSVQTALDGSNIGFNVTINNYFRMLYAHIDCFMDTFYEMLDDVKNTGRTLSDLAKVGFPDITMSDLNKATKSGDIVPPFPAIFKEEGNKRIQVYPGDIETLAESGLMPEIDYVERLLAGVLNAKSEFNIAEARIEEELNRMAEANNYGGTGNWSPIKISDILYGSQNPYSFSTTTDVGEILYALTMRAIEAKLEFGITDMDDNLASNIGSIEADNYIRCFPSNNTELLNQLTDIKPYDKIKAYIDNNKTVAYSIEDGGGSFKFKDNGSAKLKEHPVRFGGHPADADNSEFAINKDSEYTNSFYDDTNGDEFASKITNEGENDIRGIVGKRIVINMPKSDNIDDPFVADNSLIGNLYYDTNNDHTWYFNDNRDNRNIDLYTKGNLKTLLEQEWYKNKDDIKYQNDKLLMYLLFWLSWNTIVDDKNSVNTVGSRSITEGTEKSILRNLIIPDENKTGLYQLPYLYTITCGCLKYLQDNNIENISPTNVLLNYNGQYTNYEFSYKMRILSNNKTTNNTDYQKEKYLKEYLKFREEHLNDIIKWIKDSNTDEAKAQIIGLFFKKAYPNGKNNDGIESYNVEDYKSTYQYIIKDETVGKNNAVEIPTPLYNSFINRLKDEYQKQPNTGEIDPTKANVSPEFKLSLYNTLKNLYDKWLVSYCKENFKLRDPETDYNVKKARFEEGKLPWDVSENKGEKFVTEFDNFLFVDCFYNDISKKFKVNPEIPYSLLKPQFKGDTSASVYEYMYELLSRNHMIFQALPVYNNFYSPKVMEKIFSPNQVHETNIGYGATYVGMYSYEVSHVLEGESCDDDMCDDGITDLCDIAGNLRPINDIKTTANLFTYSNEGLNVTIPAFGVTYARQNQSYFTNINVNMDNPRTTEEAIKNMYLLTNREGDNDLDRPSTAANDLYSIYSNRSYNCSVEMMGCANIMPMMYFQLNNIPMFRGAYMIYSVEHHLKQGDFRTKFTGVRISKNQLPYSEGVIYDTQVFKSFGALGSYLSNVNSCGISGGDYGGSFVPPNIDLSQYKNPPGTNPRFNMKRVLEQMMYTNGTSMFKCNSGGQTITIADPPMFNRNPRFYSRTGNHYWCGCSARYYIAAGTGKMPEGASGIEWHKFHKLEQAGFKKVAAYIKESNANNSLVNSLVNEGVQVFKFPQDKTEISRHKGVVYGTNTEKGFTPQDGDIFVMNHIKYNSKTNKWEEKAGHIQMYVSAETLQNMGIDKKFGGAYNEKPKWGCCWVADIRYDNASVYPNGECTQMYIYRYV